MPLALVALGAVHTIAHQVPSAAPCHHLKQTTVSNVAAGSPRLYAHALLAWAVTGFTLWHLWRYNRIALRQALWQ